MGNNKNKVHQRKVHVGVDAEGEHGYQALLDQVQHATNGLLVPLDGLLTPPPSISKLLKSHPLLRKIPDLYSEEQLQQYAAGQANLTLFAPVDSAWDTDLDDSERKYLKSGFATKDMRELWEKHVVQSVDGHIGYTDALIQSGQINTVAGTRLDVSQDEQGYVKINKSKVVERELLAENGVVHIVENLLLPEGSLQLTPEKVASLCSQTLSCQPANTDLTAFGSQLHTVHFPAACFQPVRHCTTDRQTLHHFGTYRRYYGR